MMIATASFGHLPTIMLAAGPMSSGLLNEKKTAVRQDVVCAGGSWLVTADDILLSFPCSRVGMQKAANELKIQ